MDLQGSKLAPSHALQKKNHVRQQLPSSSVPWSARTAPAALSLLGRRALLARLPSAGAAPLLGRRAPSAGAPPLLGRRAPSRDRRRSVRTAGFTRRAYASAERSRGTGTCVKSPRSFVYSNECPELTWYLGFNPKIPNPEDRRDWESCVASCRGGVRSSGRLRIQISTFQIYGNRGALVPWVAPEQGAARCCRWPPRSGSDRGRAPT